MISAASFQPTPNRLLAAIQSLFRSRTDTTQPLSHGTARYTKSAGKLQHEATEISLTPSPKEAPEAFMWRAWNEADDGDVLEFRLRDGKISAATITRKADVPLRIEANETLEQFVARIKDTRHAPRA